MSLQKLNIYFEDSFSTLMNNIDEHFTCSSAFCVIFSHSANRSQLLENKKDLRLLYNIDINLSIIYKGNTCTDCLVIFYIKIMNFLKVNLLLKWEQLDSLLEVLGELETPTVSLSPPIAT